jgi:predicted DNA-binding transcriptional regulator AlpA
MSHSADDPARFQARSPKSTPLWCQCGQDSSRVDARLVTRDYSDATNPVQETGEVCFTRQTLARFLNISTRTLDRLAGQGLLPKPDLLVGRAARWTPQTIERWLKARPTMPGRRKKD